MGALTKDPAGAACRLQAVTGMARGVPDCTVRGLKALLAALDALPASTEWKIVDLLRAGPVSMTSGTPEAHPVALVLPARSGA